MEDLNGIWINEPICSGTGITGAFIGSYLNGASIPEAHALAVRISAYVCTQKGAMPVIPADLLKEYKW